MKLKKLFAGIVAVAMMATMAMPGFAAVSYSGNGKDGAKAFTEDEAKSVSLTKVLKVNKGTAPDNMTFDFKVYEGTGDSKTELPAQKQSATFTANGTAFNTTNGTNGTYTASFNMNVAGLVADKSVGKYTYTIVEQDNNYPGVSASWNTIVMVVSKVNANEENPDGKYNYYIALHKDAENGDKKNASEAFENTYTSNDLTLSKKVHGDFSDLGQKFKFVVEFKNAEGVDAGNYKGPMVSEIIGDGATIADNGTALNANTYLSLNKQYTVELKSGQSLKLNNLPNGIKYEIYEVGDNDIATSAQNKVTVNNNEYTVKVTSGDKNATETALTSGKLVNSNMTADVTAAFHNTNEAHPDTGVILDNAPYIALLTIVAAGAVVMIIKKRRNYED